MHKSFNKYIIIGIIFTLVFGSLQHFFYEWSGNNALVGIFSPVNESVFEHLKLLYFPMTIWIIIGYFLYGKKNRNYFFSAICGLSVGMITIPILFYLYTFFRKTNYLVIDLIIYFVSVCLSFLLFGYIYKNYNFRILSVKGGILVWELVFTMFVISFFFR